MHESHCYSDCGRVRTPAPKHLDLICFIACFFVVPGPQPLSPAEMQAVMMASEKEMFNNHQQNAFADSSPHQQYQAMMNGLTGQFLVRLLECFVIRFFFGSDQLSKWLCTVKMLIGVNSCHAISKLKN